MNIVASAVLANIEESEQTISTRYRVFCFLLFTSSAICLYTYICHFLQFFTGSSVLLGLSIKVCFNSLSVAVYKRFFNWISIQWRVCTFIISYHYHSVGSKLAKLLISVGGTETPSWSLSSSHLCMSCHNLSILWLCTELLIIFLPHASLTCVTQQMHLPLINLEEFHAVEAPIGRDWVQWMPDCWLGIYIDN